jgi:hypothetical protein
VDPYLEISDETDSRHGMRVVRARELQKDIGHAWTVSKRVGSMCIRSHFSSDLQAPTNDARDPRQMKSEEGGRDELAQWVTPMNVRPLVRQNDALNVFRHRKKTL